MAAIGTFKPSEEPNEHREFHGPTILIKTADAADFKAKYLGSVPTYDWTDFWGQSNGGIVMINFFSGFVVPESAKNMKEMFSVRREFDKEFGADTPEAKGRIERCKVVRVLGIGRRFANRFRSGARCCNP